jgi:hypothetical protein
LWDPESWVSPWWRCGAEGRNERVINIDKSVQVMDGSDKLGIDFTFVDAFAESKLHVDESKS